MSEGTDEGQGSRRRGRARGQEEKKPNAINARSALCARGRTAACGGEEADGGGGRVQVIGDDERKTMDINGEVRDGQSSAAEDNSG